MVKQRIPFFLSSVIIHLILLLIIAYLWPKPVVLEKKKPIRLTLQSRKVEEKPIIKEPEPVVKGQIVDIPDPEIEEKPLKSKYLANKSRRVEKETRTEKYKINPKVLNEEFSKEDILKKEDVIDLKMEEHSSGAKTGNNQFRLDRDGSLARLPSKFKVSNKDGFQNPTMASASSNQQAGAPNNDLLQEEIAERVQLNTNAYPFAGYMNLIRRMVNFYWKQNVYNANGPFHKMIYSTAVTVVIHRDGSLKDIKIIEESGSKEFDDAVINAFRDSAPYPPPPDALIKDEMSLRLPDFVFQVNLSKGKSRQYGYDARSGVRFPGMHKGGQ